MSAAATVVIKRLIGGKKPDWKAMIIAIIMMLGIYGIVAAIIYLITLM